MAVNPNFTNANAKTPYATGGGSNSQNPSFETIQMGSPAAGYGTITWLGDGVNASTNQQFYARYWAGQVGYDWTFSMTSNRAGTENVNSDLGVGGVKLSPNPGGSQQNTLPYGYVVGSNDGVLVQGRASGSGNLTQTWIEAHDGSMKLGSVSTITNSARTSTIDFNAFISTMASVYPAIIKPYTT